MNYYPSEDTIIALATPMGGGALAVLRLSGPRSLEIANQLLIQPISSKDARRAVFNRIKLSTQSEILDQVVVIYFRKPASYTGEDAVEISTHCNPLIIDKIIAEATRLGARIARPGEFTFRAFINQKLDLSQAEAVAEVIQSRTQQSLIQSLRHLEGRLSRQIQTIKEEIIGYLALLEINLDFGEEDIQSLSYAELENQIAHTISELDRLQRSYNYGRLLQQGIKMLILGKPNVGKSSLLNLLVGKSRAIVSEIPGTTRDYIEAHIEIEGLLVQAIDTAGIREAEDLIESIGIDQTLQQLRTSDIVLCLFDSSQPPNADDRKLIKIVEQNRNQIPFILVSNKIDLGRNLQLEETLESLELPQVHMSVVTREGLDELKKSIKSALVEESSFESEAIVITNQRHQKALQETIAALREARSSVAAQAPEEIIALDLRVALDKLGEITGETSTEDILNQIFSNFCIGK